MPPQTPKSLTSIEVWRHEVSTYSLPLPLPLQVHPNPTSHPNANANANTPPSFWRKLLPSKRSKQPGFPFSSELEQGRKGDREESVRTEMYSTSAGSGQVGKDDGGGGDGEEGEGEGEGSSMELGEGSERGIGGQLRERAERLERARRLLDGAGRTA